MPPDANAAVEELYRSDWGRIVATLIRLVGDFDLAEEAAQEAFTAAVDQWRGCRQSRNSRAPGSSRPPGTKPSTASGAGQAFEEKLESVRQRGHVPYHRGAGLRHQRNSRRSPSADLHLLPPGAGAGGAGGADAPHAGRPGNRRDRARLSGAASHHGAAAGARQAQDSRRRHSVCCARHRPKCRSGWMPC